MQTKVYSVKAVQSDNGTKPRWRKIDSKKFWDQLMDEAAEETPNKAVNKIVDPLKNGQVYSTSKTHYKITLE